VINLDLNVPSISESFHANWHSRADGNQETEWRLKLPLAVAGHSAGSLTIAGQRDEESACPSIVLISEMLEAFEDGLQNLLRDEILAKVGERRAVAAAMHH
jgi:hypothetical protein